MTSKNYRAHRLAMACLKVACLTVTGALPAYADVVPIGGGNYESVPLYRALTFGTVNFGNSSTNGQIDGIDYTSNVAPLPMARNQSSFQTNGATFTSQGAAAYSGFYAGRNYASMTVSNANPADTYYQVAGQGTATSIRFFTPEAQAARATFTWRMSGTTSNPSAVGNTTCPVPIPPPGCFPAATGRLDFGASTNPGANWLNLFQDDNNLLDSITRFGAGTFTYTLPIADLGQAINLFYWSSAYVQVNPGEAPAHSAFNLTADYFNTFVLEDVQLTDENDVPISEWAMQDLNMDEVVFNQAGRLASIAPAPDLNSVPTPPSALLAGLGLMALVWSRRQRTRR